MHAVFTCGHSEAVAMGFEYGVKPEVLKDLGKHQAYIRIGTKNHKVMTDPPPVIPEFTPPKATQSAPAHNFLKPGWIPGAPCDRLQCGPAEELCPPSLRHGSPDRPGTAGHPGLVQ